MTSTAATPPILPRRSVTDAGHFSIGPLAECTDEPSVPGGHRHDVDEIVYVTAGRGVHVVDDLALPIRPPQVFVVTRGQVHDWRIDEPLQGTLVQFHHDFTAGLGGPSIELERLTAVELTPFPRMKARIDRLITDLELETHRSDVLREMAIRTLLATLFINLHRLGPDAAAAASPHGIAARFLSHVHDNRSAALTVADCARALGVSVGHLTDLVSERTGRSPGQIIRGEVLAEAQRLLARTDLTCAQIAAEVGFDDPAYFSRFFRREGGLSPTAYRRSLTDLR